LPFLFLLQCILDLEEIHSLAKKQQNSIALIAMASFSEE
jgi:hypothetical protein